MTVGQPAATKGPRFPLGNAPGPASSRAAMHDECVPAFPTTAQPPGEDIRQSPIIIEMISGD